MQEKKDEEKKEEAEKKPAAEAKPKKPLSHVKDYEEDTVYLFQFTRSPQVSSCTYLKKKNIWVKHFRFQIPSISPFCLKLESWLKLHGIKYQVRVRTEQSTPCHPWPLVTLSLVWWGSAASLLLQCRAAVRPGCCTGLCSPAAPLTAPSLKYYPEKLRSQHLQISYQDWFQKVGGLSL